MLCFVWVDFLSYAVCPCNESFILGNLENNIYYCFGILFSETFIFAFLFYLSFFFKSFLPLSFPDLKKFLPFYLLFLINHLLNLFTLKFLTGKSIFLISYIILISNSFSWFLSPLFKSFLQHSHFMRFSISNFCYLIESIIILISFEIVTCLHWFWDMSFCHTFTFVKIGCSLFSLFVWGLTVIIVK